MQNSRNNRFLKFLFVFIQFGGIAIILVTGPPFALTSFLFSIELSGILLGIWAVIAMKIDNLSILPDLKEDARFVNAGPYRVIRHPMYLAICITLMPLIINTFNYFRLTVFIITIFDLVFKLNYEEKRLTNAFKEYRDYKRKTWRLIPFIY